MFSVIGNIRNSKGMGIVEIFISMSIAIVGILGAFSLLANVRGTLAENSETVQVQQDARIIVENIARELRESSPQVINPDPLIGSDHIVFFTPRDENGTFIVDAQFRPTWQRRITYSLDSDSQCLYRYQEYIDKPWISNRSELVARDVQRLLFTLKDDIVAISIRAISDKGGEIGNAADAYTDFSTNVRLRN